MREVMELLLTGEPPPGTMKLFQRVAKAERLDMLLDSARKFIKHCLEKGFHRRYIPIWTTAMLLTMTLDGLTYSQSMDYLAAFVAAYPKKKPGDYYVRTSWMAWLEVAQTQKTAEAILDDLKTRTWDDKPPSHVDYLRERMWERGE